jgi:argininosuccinate lyase
MTNNLPSGYFRDLQLIKEIFIPAFEELKSCLSIACFAVSHMNVNEKIMDDNRYENIYSVEEVNRMVVEGIPFREAYQKVGESIKKGTFHPDKTIRHTHQGSIGNLCLAEIELKMEQVLRSFNFEKAEKAFEQLISGSN